MLKQDVNVLQKNGDLNMKNWYVEISPSVLCEVTLRVLSIFMKEPHYRNREKELGRRVRKERETT